MTRSERIVLTRRRGLVLVSAKRTLLTNLASTIMILKQHRRNAAATHPGTHEPLRVAVTTH